MPKLRENRDKNYGVSIGTWPARLHAAWELALPFFPQTTQSQHLRVADFGAGRQELRALLPAAWSYHPFDHLPRTPDTTVCDFNRDLPNGQFDIIFCLGVFEYLRHPERFLRHALAHSEWLVFSNFSGWNPWRAWVNGWRGRLTVAQSTAAIAAENRAVLSRQRWKKDGALWVCGRPQG